MDEWVEIRRRVLVDGESKRSIVREFGIHWKTLQKVLAFSEPPGYRRRGDRPQPVIGPHLGVIASILDSDKSVHPKQRHTAKRIFERLQSEHQYAGSYTQVKDAVARFRRKSQEVFVPLVHPAGEAQVDFGHADVEIEGEPIKAAFFVMVLPYSDAIFVCAFPRECPEAFFEGHVRAFEYFGGVPSRITYDNTTSAVAKILGPRLRELTREFKRFQSHHLFDVHFCRVRRGNEKGVVENMVGYARRNFMVPVPKVNDLEVLNAELLRRADGDLDRRVRGEEKEKRVLLEEDRTRLLPLPKQRFDARRVETTRSSSLSLVRFDHNDYSVPTEYAHHEVIAIGGISSVKLVVLEKVVATHRRSWKKEKVFFDPVHYLALLERKPGAFDFARPLAGLDLPESFGVLRRRLEKDLSGNGTREFIRVLRLLEHATFDDLKAAVEQALSIGATGADAIRLILEQKKERPAGLFSLEGRPHLKLVYVAPPDLSVYGRLATGG